MPPRELRCPYAHGITPFLTRHDFQKIIVLGTIPSAESSIV
jgi:hypothetical protein